ncbi:MAG: prolyl oligopeptidase family serine peptidase, partial [Pirellulaceae bacterium]|nr:prolyl oligopeptidase family serine peptidase [Pirellulaceae bacterium]
FEQMLVSGELADTLRMTRWVQGWPFADRSRLAILGFSLGGLLASCADARMDAFRAMVLLAPTTVENLNRFARKKDGGGRVLLGPHELHARFFEDLSEHDPVIDVVHRSRPTLVVQGTADTAVEPSVSGCYVETMQRAGVPVTYHLIDGADHAFTKAQVRQELIDTVNDWLERQLRY